MSQELPILLQSICLNIGIREPLEAGDCKNIFNFLKRNFKLLNLTDLLKAFDLFSGQELEFSDPKFGHYGSFDLVFIGKVLKAYQKWKIKEALKPKKVVALNTDRQIEVSTKTKEENAKEWFEHVDKEIKTTSSDFILADWDAIYWHMEKEKIIKLDKEEKEMFLENVRFDIQEEMKHRKLERKNINNQERMLSSEGSLKRECRKRIVIKHFDK